MFSYVGHFSSGSIGLSVFSLFCEQVNFRILFEDIPLSLRIIKFYTLLISRTHPPRLEYRELGK